jgi:hypothetical protein
MKIKAILFLLLIRMGMHADAQMVYHLGTPGCDCFGEYIFQENNPLPLGYLITEVPKDMDIKEFAKSSVLSNPELNRNWNVAFYKVLDTPDYNIFKCMDALNKIISLAKGVNPRVAVYLYDVNLHKADVIGGDNWMMYEFHTVITSTIQLEQAMAIAKARIEGEPYLRPITTGLLDQQMDQMMKNYRGNWDVNLAVVPVFFHGKNHEMPKSRLATYVLSVQKNVGENWSMDVNVGFSMNKPNASGLQSGLQSKMMSAIQNEEDTLFLNETLEGHFLLESSIGLRYSFNKKGPCRPYIGVSTGICQTMKMSGTISDTLDLTDIDMSDPQSMQSGLGEGLGDSVDPSDAMSQEKSQLVLSALEIGLEYRMSPRLNSSIGYSLRRYQDVYGWNDPFYASSLRFGLGYTWNARRILKKPIK